MLNKISRKKVVRFLVRECLLAFVCIFVGTAVVLVIWYPDTQIVIGFGYKEDGATRVPTVLLDFSTPTVEQMLNFKSVDDFDRWAVGYVVSQLADEGIILSATTLLIRRVPSLAESSPEKLFRFTSRWSGLERLRDHLLYRPTFKETAKPIVLPYLAVLVLRLVVRATQVMRRLRSPV